MNINKITITLKVCFVLIILASCESHEQKQNDAFELFKKKKMLSADSLVIINETEQKAVKVEVAKNSENTNEWLKFKNETERKILANEHKIKKIKQTSNSSSKFLKKMEHLENENNDLKKKLKDFEEEAKINLEKFKEKINLEVIEVDTKIKDLSNSEKK